MQEVRDDVRVPRNRRRLTDLYQRGKTLNLNDDSDEDPIEIYISKLNDLEQKQALEKAGGNRARHLAMLHNKNDEGRNFYVEQLTAFEATSPESLISLIIQPKFLEEEASVEKRIAAEDEWTQNGYLESLNEAWLSGMEEQYKKDPEDPDAKRIFDELKRYTEQVEEELQSIRSDMIKSYENRPYEELLEKAVDHLIEIDSSTVWLDSYNRWLVFFATREVEDHTVRYFESKEEVDRLDKKILDTILDHLNQITVEISEGKDSGATQNS